MNRIITFIAKRVASYGFEPFTSQVIVGLTLFIVGLFALLLIVSSFESCSGTRKSKKIENTKTAIVEDKFAANVAANTVKEKENESKNTNANFSNVLRTDSNKYNSNFSAAKKRFCADPDHVSDSACVGVR